MKKKGLMLMIMAVFAVIFISGCKQNVGSPEDNAVVEEAEEDTEETGEEMLFGYSCPDLSNPFYHVLKDSIATELESRGDPILVRDAQTDPALQASQIQEMIDAQVDLVFLCPVDQEQITGSLEALKEAGARTPGAMGQTMSIVGGLVLGQAAVSARFAAAPTVIVVAIAGVAAQTICLT